MKNQIKKLAAELGFDQVGITRPSLLKEGEDAIREWVKEGKHGTMRYLEEFDARRERFFRSFRQQKGSGPPRRPMLDPWNPCWGDGGGSPL